MARIVPRTTFFCSLCYDKEGGMSICAYHWPDGCKDVSVTNNIVAGAYYSAYLAPAHKCGEADTQTVFRNNVAHSVDGGASGEGLVTFPNPADPWTDQCFEASHFKAYKIKNGGVEAFQKTHKTVMSNMVLVDNHYSFALNLVCPSDYAETEILI